ncbi:MAG: hydrogenase maturation protease [Verrucomicrobiia bacterium]
MKSPVLIIGIGNPDRGDDAVGVIVAQRLRQRLPAQVPILQTTGDPGFLLEAWQTAETVILIDAVQSGAPPGTIHRLDAHESPLPANFFRCSTHALGLPEAIELARALNLSRSEQDQSRPGRDKSRSERDELPPQLIVYGIEAKDFTAGTGLSVPVEQAADQLVDTVCCAHDCIGQAARAVVP